MCHIESIVLSLSLSLIYLSFPLSRRYNNICLHVSQKSVLKYAASALGYSLETSPHVNLYFFWLLVVILGRPWSAFENIIYTPSYMYSQAKHVPVVKWWGDLTKASPHSQSSGHETQEESKFHNTLRNGRQTGDRDHPTSKYPISDSNK